MKKNYKEEFKKILCFKTQENNQLTAKFNKTVFIELIKIKILIQMAYNFNKVKTLDMARILYTYCKKV
jgi:hypothetical protein